MRCRKFRALAVVDPGFLRDEPKEVVVEGDHVDLAGKFGHPEAVDDVLRSERDVDRPANRDVHLVSGYDFLVGISEFEPPAVADGFDLENVASVGWRSPLLFPYTDDGGDGDCGDDYGREHGPRDFEFGVAVDLFGDLVVAASVPDGGIDDGAFYNDEDGNGDPEDEDEEVALVTGDGATVVEG